MHSFLMCQMTIGIVITSYSIHYTKLYESPVLDSASRSMSVKLEPADNDGRIKAGMFARVKLITDTRTDIVIVV